MSLTAASNIRYKSDNAASVKSLEEDALPVVAVTGIRMLVTSRRADVEYSDDPYG